MDLDFYTYRVNWSPEDGEYVGLCVEWPSLSWLAESQEKALAGIRQVVSSAVVDMQVNGEEIPTPITVIKVVDLPEFDATLYLDSEMAIAAYLAVVQGDGDAALLEAALRDIAHAREKLPKLIDRNDKQT